MIFLIFLKICHQIQNKKCVKAQKTINLAQIIFWNIFERYIRATDVQLI